MTWMGAGLCGVALAGCGQSDAPVGCDGMPAGLDRDVCFGKELKALPSAEIDQVIGLASKMDDPMVRGEAVFTWVTNNGNGIPPDKGQKLCGMLEERDGAHCLRRLSSPHLQRDH